MVLWAVDYFTVRGQLSNCKIIRSIVFGMKRLLAAKFYYKKFITFVKINFNIIFKVKIILHLILQV